MACYRHERAPVGCFVPCYYREDGAKKIKMEWTIGSRCIIVVTHVSAIKLSDSRLVMSAMPLARLS